MNGRQHLAFGIAQGVAVSMFVVPSMPAPEKVLFVSMSVLGSLFPDLDHPKSILSKEFGIFGKPFQIAGHRTYLHDPALVLALMLLTIKYPIFYGFFVAWIGHLFLDSLTIAGIPVLYISHLWNPNRKNVHLLPRILRVKSSSSVFSGIYTGLSCALMILGLHALR